MKLDLAHFWRALLLALAACAVSVPLAAQIPQLDPDATMPGMGSSGMGRRARYVVSGTVLEAGTNRPLDFVSVRLLTLSAGSSAATTTNGSGNFSFAEVPSGDYILIVDEKGYQRVQEQLSLRNDLPMGGVQLYLRRDAPYDPKVGGGITVSARELSIPRKAREAMQRGQRMISEDENYRGSLDQFQRAVREYPDYYEAYLQMGLVYLKLGDSAQAEKMLHTSVDLSERKYVDALNTLALVYTNQKHFDQAEPLARDAVQLNPDSWDANVGLAQALYGLDRSEEAEPFAQKAMELHPDGAPVLLLLFNIHLRQRNYSSALDDVNRYLDLAPNSREAGQARVVREQLLKHLAAPTDSADPTDSTDEDPQP